MTKKHGLTGKQGNRTLNDESQRLKRRVFAENDECWPEYEKAAAAAGMKPAAWMRSVLRKELGIN